MATPGEIRLRFRFIHAADLHLDSPLLGLTRKSEDYAARIDDASRRAFDNLIGLAIEAECRLMVIAGDVFDGQWRDYRTGQFFVDRMRRLRQAGIRVVMIAGNHDAENRFANRLELSDNVTLLSARRPETVRLEELGVAIHGRSFPHRDVTDNIALDYPRPIPERFNIGLLHTACSGREGHAGYAPCTMEQLVNHGYQYWALGHIHAREVLSEAPHIVFPGNLQGRSVRETGAKGATLVTVESGAVAAVEHRPLDVIRWAVETLDISGFDDRKYLLPAIRSRVDAAHGATDGRALAIRLRLAGATPLHADLVTGAAELREDVDTLVAGIAADIWLEKLEIRTTPPILAADRVDPTVAGNLRATIEALAADPWLAGRLSARLAEIRTKLPAGARADQLFAQLEANGAAGARTLALALLEKGQS
jgi:DNA repair exonuclease SbcCD nuclease subunit